MRERGFSETLVTPGGGHSPREEIVVPNVVLIGDDAARADTMFTTDLDNRVTNGLTAIGAIDPTSARDAGAWGPGS